MIRCHACLIEYPDDGIAEYWKGKGTCWDCFSTGNQLIPVGCGLAKMIIKDGVGKLKIIEEEKMDKDEFVTMLYSIQERVQIITERLEDDHAIQACYQLGGLREYLKRNIADFEEGERNGKNR